MDEAVAEKFCDNLKLTKKQISTYENLFKKDILPAIDRRYLSHLVTTIEDLINKKKKQAFLEHIKEKKELDFNMLEKTVDRKILRLFSIILAPVESGKLKARTYFFRGDYCTLITYWKELPPDQIRILIAHELGHIVNRYIFENAKSSSEDGLATLFGYIVLQDRNDFYKNKAKHFTHKYDMMIYDEIANLCNRENM